MQFHFSRNISNNFLKPFLLYQSSSQPSIIFSTCFNSKIKFHSHIKFLNATPISLFLTVCSSIKEQSMAYL